MKTEADDDQAPETEPPADPAAGPEEEERSGSRTTERKPAGAVAPAGQPRARVAGAGEAKARRAQVAGAAGDKASRSAVAKGAEGGDVAPGQDPGEEPASASRLSWLERRHAGRIAKAAEQVALERMAERSEAVRAELEERVSRAASEAARAVEGRLEKSRGSFANLLREARATVQELRDQLSEVKRESAGLEERRTEARAQAAAAHDKVRGALDKAVKDLTAQAEEESTRLREGMQEVSGFAETLRKELSVRSDSAVQRLDRSLEQLDARAADLKRIGAELDEKLEAAAERMAVWQQATQERTDKAIRELKNEGDQQVQRLDSRIELLEAQRERLQQQSAQVQEESSRARQQAVTLEELVKKTTTEVETRIGSAEREFDRRLADGKEMLEAVRADREREREHWEEMREQVVEEHKRTTDEIREFFLVQLATIKSRVEAVAEGGGPPPPALDQSEASLREWTPGPLSDRVRGDVDLNSAGISELRSLGLTMTQARRVVEHRERNGPFDSIDEFDEIPGFTGEQRAVVKRRSVVR